VPSDYLVSKETKRTTNVCLIVLYCMYERKEVRSVGREKYKM